MPFPLHFYESFPKTSHHSDEEIYVGTESRVIYTNTDISLLIDDVIMNFNEAKESGYIQLFALNRIDVHIAKVKALEGAWGVFRNPLFQSLFHFQNEDNLCFVYSVLCGLKTPGKNGKIYYEIIEKFEY